MIFLNFTYQRIKDLKVRIIDLEDELKNIKGS